MTYFTPAPLAAALVLLAQAAPAASVWHLGTGPAQPYRYVESPPISRLAPQIENADIYVSDSLFLRLYPSINTGKTAENPTTDASIASKTREIGPIRTRGNLSPSYVQEFAYIDAYTNSREYEEFFTFPSIRMSLAMPRIGNGFGGGYQPLQFGFGPAAFRFW